MKAVHIISCAVFAMSASVHAQSTTDHAAHHAPAASASAEAAPMVDGEIRKVDKEQNTVTIKHGRITNLDMPGMTMVFKAGNPMFLDGLKQGDKIKFTADNIKGALTVTSIELVK
ncbi:MAG: copper-binding protein [Aquabacterium sp.]